MNFPRLQALTEAVEPKKKKVPLENREFKVTKAGNNGGDVGDIIDSGWFTDANHAPYYLRGYERGQLKNMEIGDKETITVDAGSITIERVK